MCDLPNKSRKRLVNIIEDLEDGEIIDNQSTEVELDPFSDGFDDRLLGDAVDHARLQGYSELNREYEQYHRYHHRDGLRGELVIKSQLARDNPSNQLHSGEIEMKERSKVRRLNLDERSTSKKRENAFGRLMAIRHNKMITKKEPEKKSMDEVYQHPHAKKVKLKAIDIYSDDSSNSDLEAEFSPEDTTSVAPEVAQGVRLVSTLDELSRGVLSRNQLESFLDKPIFERTITNCFVRVNIGLPGIRINQVYRISQIAGLEQSKREYHLGSRRTSLILRLRHAGQYVYTQMDVVSNHPMTPLEFNVWMNTCQREGYPLPPLAIIEEKAKDIDVASNYSFTEGDVEKMVLIKRKEGKKTVSAAYKKVCLIMERDMAVDWNDVETANRLEKKIRKMDRNPEPEREQSIESLRIAQVTSVLPSRKSFAERLPKSNDFDLERYMRRKYKKSALVSRARVDTEEWEYDPTITVTSEEKAIDCTNTKDEDESQKLDLYKLYDFDVVIDVSSLPPLGVILKDIKI